MIEEQRRYILLIWLGVLLGTALAMAGLGYLLIWGLRRTAGSEHPLIGALCLGMSTLVIPGSALMLLRPLVRRLDERPAVQRALWLGALTVLMALTPLLLFWMIYLLATGPAVAPGG